MFTRIKSVKIALIIALVSSALITPTGAIADEATVSNNYRENHYNPSDSDHSGPAIPIVGMPLKGAAAGPAVINGVITYHLGGPVMINPNIYVVWYGTWTNPCAAAVDNSTPAIVNDLIKGIGPTPWNAINTRYYSQTTANGPKTYVTPVVTWTGCTYDNSSLGKALDGTNQPTTAAIVDRALTNNALARDTNGLYFVFTSSDVITSGFVNSTTPQFCGYHSYMNPTYDRTKKIIYSFVGDPGSAVSSCNGQSIAGVSPNSNPQGDAMTSVIAHELVEAVSDPLLNAWYDAKGNENADKCAWTFGTQSTLPSGAKYNMVASGRNYLIQQNWIPDGAGSCAMALAPLSATTAVSSKFAMVGTAVASFTPVTSAGGIGSKVFTVSPALPAGLTLNATTGAISGTPTVSIGSTAETITVTDSNNSSVSSTFTLQVSPKLVATVSIAAQTIVHNAARPAITPFIPVVGSGSAYTPLTYSISPALPAGLTISSITGAISGTAPAAAVARRTYTVRATDGKAFTASGNFNLTIS